MKDGVSSEAFGPLTRRQILRAVGALGVTGALGDVRRVAAAVAPLNPFTSEILPAVAGSPGVTPGSAQRWSSRDAWPDRRVPGAGDIARIDRPVLLDVDATVAGVEIAPAGALLFDPSASRSLHTTGNIVVAGTLVMRPRSASVSHVLRFLNVRESKFQGGGMQVLSTDVGLWIVGAGTLDAAGTRKRAWTRATGSLKAGATSIVVSDASGWAKGDSIAVTPTTAPSVDNGGFHQDVDHCLTYDEAVVVDVSANRVTLDRPLAHDHPAVSFSDWTGRQRTFGAEVLNLSRNVVIEGTEDGRTHVAFLATSRPQAVSDIAIRHVAPRKQSVDMPTKTEGVLGRYGLHFHRCGDGSRGSVIERVVVHGSGGHAFVPHDSHGVTFRECVAHDTRDVPFWWDMFEKGTTYRPSTADTMFDSCVASKVWADKTGVEGYRLAGFTLGEGPDTSNSCINCVAVGVHGEKSTMNTSLESGFLWHSAGRAIWNFRGCLAHNIGGSGILTWQNDEQVHVLEEFIAYHCGKSGIEHGAYSNFWQFRKMALYANRRAGLAIHAVTRRTNSVPAGAPLLAFEDIWIDGGDRTTWGVHAEAHRFASPADGPTLIARAKVQRCREASYYEGPQQAASYAHFVGCDFQTKPEFWIDDGAAPATLLKVERLNGASNTFELRRRDQTGALVPAWNARRR